MNFIDNSRIELYRDNLLKPIKRSWEKLTKEELTLCVHELDIVFLRWKKEHGESPLSLNRLLQISPIESFEDAKPYKCAGYGISNYTDLAFKLWIDNYEPFKEIYDKYSIQSVLAVTYDVIDEVNNTTSIASLIRLSCLIYETEANVYKRMLEDYFLLAKSNRLDNKRAHKMLSGLNNGGREKGVLTNKLRAQEKKNIWRRMAIDIFRDKPHFNYDQVAHYIYGTNNAYKNIKKGTKYSERTIKDAIARTRTETR